MFTTVENVKSFFRSILTTGANASVTDAEINTWIEVDQAYVLGKFYTLYRPVNVHDNPLSVKIIGDIIAMFVADRVDTVLNNYLEKDKKPMWKREARERLEEYVPRIDKDGNQPTPNVTLPDAEFLGSGNANTRITISSRTAPTFRKDRDNW